MTISNDIDQWHGEGAGVWIYHEIIRLKRLILLLIHQQNNLNDQPLTIHHEVIIFLSQKRNKLTKMAISQTIRPFKN